MPHVATSPADLIETIRPAGRLDGDRLAIVDEPAFRDTAIQDLAWTAVFATDEATQAEYYRQAFELAACQPTVIAVLIFHLADEADLNRWQSGPYYADTKPKSSLPAIREAAKKARQGKLVKCS